MMNEDEIDAAQATLRSLAAGRYATFLRDFKDVVSDGTDGWAYFQPARNAARGLCRLIEAAVARERGRDRSPPPREEDYAKALRPMKAFLTRREMKEVTLGA